MAIEGKLEEVGLADICQLLAMGRKSGLLSVTDRSNFGHIHFQDGRVVHASVLNRRDRLGELLVANTVIEPEELEGARQAAGGESDVHFGRVLVESGRLSPEDLERFQRIQVEEAVYHLFTWEEGSFHFASGEGPETGVPVLVSIPAENLLLEGARRVDEWSQIREVVRSMDDVFRLVEDPRADPDANVPPPRARILDLLDGGRSVRQIVREAGTVDFEVARTIFDLHREGRVERVERRAASQAESRAELRGEEEAGPERALKLGRAFYGAGMLEEAERELLACLEADPDMVEALERLALIAFRKDRLDEALDYIEQAERKGEPRYPRARNHALFLESLERFDEALRALDRAEGLTDGEPGLHLARGVVLFKAGRGGEAVGEFEKYRDSLGPDAEPDPMYFAYGVLAAAMVGEMDAALRLGREGLTLHPWSGPILVNLGVVLERQGEPAAAEALYLRATGEPHTPAQAHRNLGDLALRRGDEQGARAHYEKAVRLDPELGDEVFLRLGTFFYEDGDHDSARRLWRRALELNPANEVVRSNLGLVAAESRS